MSKGPAELVLVIDTASADCMAAVCSSVEDRQLAIRQEAIGKGHAERLMDMIEAVVAESGHGLEEIGLIAVTVGPGSFTGIRVGVAAARGLGLALSVPVVGVTSLEALAASRQAAGGAGTVMVAIDAKRDEIYCQLFDEDASPINDPCVMSVDKASRLAASFDGVVTGSGARLLRPDAEFRSDRIDSLAVARLAAARQNAPGKPAPLYLRAPDAKPQSGFALERRG